jgi:hypothetical protein
MSGNDNESKESDREILRCTEGHRFWLAVLLVGGFLALLFIDLIMGGYYDIATLAGIFSGWIVAIIGFYFMDQASARTQQQAVSITDKAERKVTGMADKGSQSAEDLEQSMKMARETIASVKEERDNAIRLAGEFEKALQKALS